MACFFLSCTMPARPAFNFVNTQSGIVAVINRVGGDLPIRRILKDGED